jgi:DNA-binding XRE family transcriptional regulator
MNVLDLESMVNMPATHMMSPMATKPNHRQASSSSVRFGIRLRELRMEKGISQEALAHAAKLHPTYLSSLERGKRNPTLNVIVALAKALGFPPSHLLADRQV